MNYYLDITEEEYTDTTYTVSVEDEQTGEWSSENPTFVGFPYRSMHQLMISNMLPTIMWNIQITPIKAHYTMYKESISDFLVRLCAILGGIFAAATIFESIVRNGLCLMIPAFDEQVPSSRNERNGPQNPRSAAAVGDASNVVQMTS